MDCGPASKLSDQKLCERCQALDILSLLEQDLPWETTSDLNRLATNGTEKFQSIGKTGSIEFWEL